MSTIAPTPNVFLEQRLFTPRETASERAARVRESLRIARQMLTNGCDINEVTRYTGLSEGEVYEGLTRP